ncbi:AmpG family muropeptide MFS transporter [Tahibacter amnicola]|uniref:MFS transporter n=1 Tax=Tahibacter amnicola TaxID=2976241 RepID=A0ABY6BFE8_9GAMM|nr:MFS transporter [Tahibacter amnicola]UXI68242.1 MFS transporter [Tahibacter amnicola]
MSARPESLARESGFSRLRRAFAQPAALTLCFLGFGAGLPFLLVGVTLGYWFREAGLSLGSIGLVSYISLLYVLKFFWAPLLDRYRAPLFGRLGRRRGWLVLSQLGVVLGLVGMAMVGPTGQLPLFLTFLALTTFAGATQDSVVDAYRIDVAAQEDQAALVTTYSFGYRFGLIAGGAGALYAAQWLDWQRTYLIEASLMLLPLLAIVLSREPAAAVATEQPIDQPLVDQLARGGMPRGLAGVLVAYLAPIIAFFRSNGSALALTLLLFVGLYKLPDQMIGVMAGPFYLDSGFTKAQIATVSKLYGVWLGLAGATLGGVAATLWPIRRGLLVAAFGVALSNFAFLLMWLFPQQLWAFVAAISADNFCQGFAGTVLVAFMSGLADRRFSATQYALLSSLANLPGKLIGGVSGFFVESFGYAAFFAFSALSIIPTLWIFARLRHWMERDRVDG